MSVNDDHFGNQKRNKASQSKYPVSKSLNSIASVRELVEQSAKLRQSRSPNNKSFKLQVLYIQSQRQKEGPAWDRVAVTPVIRNGVHRDLEY